jgi:hypothetical protein
MREGGMDKNLDIAPSITEPNLRNWLHKLTKSNSAKRVHVTPDIPEKQLRNATASMGIPAGSHVLVLVDDSLTKSGKGGICVTSDGMYWKKLLAKGSVKFGDVKQFDMNLGFWMTFKINGQEISLDQFSKKEIQPFADFLLNVLGLEQTPAGITKKKAGVKKKSSRVTKKDTEALMRKRPDVRELEAKEDAKGLIKALKDERKKVRAAAARALGQIADKRAVEPLMWMLKDESMKVREAAARALGRIVDKRAVEPLMQILEDESGKVREAAVRALGSIGDKRAIKRLSKFLEYGDTEGAGNIKEAARVALLKINEGKVSIKKGQCPICETEYKSWEGRKLRCNYCGADLVVKQNQFLEEPLEEVTESPKYKVVIAHTEQHDAAINLILHRSPFTSHGPISLVWPTFCCLCLRPVKKSNFYKISSTVYAGGGFTTTGEYAEYSTEYKLEIPYCKDCRHKVRKFFGHREEEGVSIETGGTASETRVVLQFRNPQYARIFRQANKEQIRRYGRKPRFPYLSI